MRDLESAFALTDGLGPSGNTVARLHPALTPTYYRKHRLDGNHDGGIDESKRSNIIFEIYCQYTRSARLVGLVIMINTARLSVARENRFGALSFSR